MKIATYRITAKAVEDLEEIWFYTNNKWSAEQADRYYKLLIEEFEFLSKNPLTGKSVDHIRAGYRVSIVKSHVVFYHQLDHHQIEIVRILHQSMGTDSRIEE